MDPESADVDGRLEFRHHVSELFLKNECSGKQTSSLLRKASLAGASGIADIAKAGGSGAHDRNASRDLMRQLTRGCSLPELYFADIPLWSPSTMALESVQMPFILPHEVIHRFVEKGGTPALAKRIPGVESVVSKVCSSLKLDPMKFVAIGLHGDGVPHQERKSIECITWNILAEGMVERFPFAIIEKDFTCRCGCSGKHTLWPMLEVFCWSIKALLQGGLS